MGGRGHHRLILAFASSIRRWLCILNQHAMLTANTKSSVSFSLHASYLSEELFLLLFGFTLKRLSSC